MRINYSSLRCWGSLLLSPMVSVCDLLFQHVKWYLFVQLWLCSWLLCAWLVGSLLGLLLWHEDAFIVACCYCCLDVIKCSFYISFNFSQNVNLFLGVLITSGCCLDRCITSLCSYWVEKIYSHVGCNEADLVFAAYYLYFFSSPSLQNYESVLLAHWQFNMILLESPVSPHFLF